MTTPKHLRIARPNDGKLGLSTIMDRALAQRYGAAYVHVAAFAIDIDRAYRLLGDTDRQLPFGWEVFLTEVRLIRLLDESEKDPTPMLEEMCLGVMDLPKASPDQQGVLGAQLPFAVYTGVAHEQLPTRLGSCFQSWRKPPSELIHEVAALFETPGLTARLAQRCLHAALEPPLVAPVREALEALAAGA